MGIFARLHIVPEPQASGFPFTVILAAAESDATPAAFYGSLSKPGATSALLTHDKDVEWTDTAGVLLLQATLRHGGIVMMAFATLADAMAARRKAVGVLA